MSVERSSYDVIVVGGGYAGATVARDLAAHGNAVVLLEARERLGGRTWSTTFPGTDVEIEMGGQFVSRENMPNMALEMERYGVDSWRLPAAQSSHMIFNGNRRTGLFPVPAEHIVDVERAAVHCVLAAARIERGVPLDQQALSDLDVSLAEFLAPLELPAETYEFVESVFGLFTFRFAEEVSTLQALTFLADRDLSPYSLFAGVSENIRTGQLVSRIASDGSEIRLGCPVARVDQTGDEVLVTTAAGETLSAAAVVIAVPMNVWNEIEFAPRLSEQKRVACAERHGCERVAKAVMRVRNAPKNPDVIAAPRWADGGMMLWTQTEDAFDNDDQLMTLFGYSSLEGDDFQLDFNQRESVERTLQAMLPGAELVEYTHHDWVADPHSKGVHVSWRPGRVSKSHSALAASEGRLAFATADVAFWRIGTIEGAVESGHRAARRTQNQLARERAAHGVGVAEAV